MDQSAAIARYFVEMPHAEALAIQAMDAGAAGDHLATRFPGLTVAEVERAANIATELLDADAQERRHRDMVNNPCPCGEPGIVVLQDDDGRLTGERRCLACDEAEATAEKHPCIRCGAPLPGLDVRAGINLCRPCDPEEYGWIDPITGEP